MHLFERLAALSDPTRVRLLRLLALEELAVGELARVVQAPQSTVSRHLKQLHAAGLVFRRSEGTAGLYVLDAERLDEAAAALWAVVQDQVGEGWGEDLARLESVLALRTVDSRAFFGRVAGRWDELRTSLFGTEFMLPTLLHLLPSDVCVADLGCGTGGVVALLAPVCARVVGVDREEAMLEAAARRVEGLANVELVRADLDDLPLPDASVDVALCMLVLHHIPEPGAVFAEVARTLRPGGRLLVLDMVEHGRDEWRTTMGHQHQGFAERALAELACDAGLEPARRSLLPPAPDAQGPPLFVALFRRPFPP